MITDIIKKIRALVEDFPTREVQIFNYTISNVFTLAEPNITSIDAVLVNGTPLSGGQSYLYDSSTKKITVNGVSFLTGNKIEVDYTFNQRNDSDLTEYIRAALCWLSIFEYSNNKFELKEDIIYDTPTSGELNLIAIIASILIKPDCQSMSLPNLKVVYAKTLTKEEKIENLITQFQHGAGVSGVISVDYKNHGGV